ncbi:MAG: DUF475 domain-containing protein [SAR324 cluster bacterium]|nr:DUF475 domain-containing protein [SAR324 cluster bacterium]
MDFSAVLVVANIVLIEALLSLDNAAVLALLVAKVEEKDRRKLMTIGVFLAYFFRVLALLLAFWLIQFWQLKMVGGLYLVYLGLTHLFSSDKSKADDKKSSEKNSKEKKSFKYINIFWRTALSIGVIDLIFSIDNVFVVVSLSDNIYLIWFGVFISIVTLMMVVGVTSKFISRYPALQTAVLYVVILLGIKLIVHSLDFLMPHFYQEILDSEAVQIATSLIIFAVFGSTLGISYLKEKLNNKISK